MFMGVFICYYIYCCICTYRQRFCLVYKQTERGEHGDVEIEMTVEPPLDTRACSVSSRTLTEREAMAPQKHVRDANAIFKDFD